MATLVGQTVSHYKILERLGGGGMGVVYKAQDLKLDRHVALKFLPPDLTRDPEAKQRFVQEAKAASALDHPNICNVHDIGEAGDGQIFIVMAHYEGETLKKKIERGPLKIDEAIDVAAQVAQGLMKAHEHGISHRDIKPANIMITTDGVVKIVDFGLAKLRGRTMLTTTGSTLGTAAYMSPEQARGDPADHRTDIWSLGVVLYEMLTGRRPFDAEYENALLYSVLSSDPEPMTGLRAGISMELERIVRKCMSKAPARRYQSADELLVDVRGARQETSVLRKGARKPSALSLGIGTGTAILALALFVYLFVMPEAASPRVQSVAVLPFVDMSPQKDQEYFSDGVTEELINRLAKIRHLRVPARTSAFMFKGKTEDIRHIGSTLNVQTVLEGSVRKAGNSLRVTAQLIDVADGYHLWSETYERELKDVFAIQDDIASAIVSALKLELAAQEEDDVLATPSTLNPEAHRLYLQGRYFRHRNTHQDVTKGLPYFQQAIEKDSAYALGWSGLADIYMMIDLLSGVPPIHHAQSREAAQKALALDPFLPEAHVALGLIQMCYEWNWSGARRSLERAIELNPNAGQSYLEYGVLLQRTGEIDASIAAFKRGIELDPLAWAAYLRLGVSHSLAGNHQYALDELMRGRELSPTEFSQSFGYWIGWTHYLQGSYEKARTLFSTSPSLQLLVESARGNQKFAREWIAARHKADPPVWSTHWDLARAYACINEQDKAIDCLERVYQLYPMIMMEIELYPDFKGLSSHPRFVALLQRIGLHH